MKYTNEEIRLIIAQNSERLYKDYSSRRPEGWRADQRTHDMICLGVWLNEELAQIGIDDLGRITQIWQFNRRSRSEDDLFAIVSEIMNESICDKIDRKRTPHRRWG